MPSHQSLRWTVIIGCLLITGTVFMITDKSIEVSATSTSEKVALIFVTNNTNSDTNEVIKVNSLYDFLLDNGWEADDITLLGPVTVSNNDGIANFSNVEDGLDDLEDNTNTDKEILIYISDNGYPDNTTYQFILTDYFINSTVINNSIDNMTYSTLSFIVCGNQSGQSGDFFKKDGIVFVSSMNAIQSASPDEFNITRSLEDPNADSNSDGDITFLEAAERERVVLASYTLQVPQIWV